MSPSTGCRAGASGGSPRGRSRRSRPCGSARASSRRCSPARAGSAASRPACRDAECRHRARCRRRASSPTRITVDILGDQRLEEGAPGLLRNGRVLIREVDDLHAVLAMQPRELLGEADRVAMAPARPETALAAIVAQVRTAARELHDDRAQAAPIAVAGMVDQLPADPVGVEVADHRARLRRAGAVARRGTRCPQRRRSCRPRPSAAIRRRAVSSPSPRTIAVTYGSSARISRQ